MQRCLELAALGSGYVAPNPLVGAVLVYNDQVIGEGYHREYGQPHAEVICIGQAILNGYEARLAESTLYVSLEPCVHFGKTPPCTDLITRYKIPKVVIGCRDPFKEVDGKGIEKLKAAGVNVEEVDGVLTSRCKEINKRFFTFHTRERPYIILKWAQTANGKIASASAERLLITNEYTNRLVHQWRGEEASILVGTDTALLDNPELTTRLWPGPSPIRLVIDRELRLPAHLNIFDGQQPTIIFNTLRHDMPGEMTASLLKQKAGVWHYQVKPPEFSLKEILKALYHLNIQSVLVEGGAKLLQSFIEEGLWDETRIIKNEQLIVNHGLNAPLLQGADKIAEQELSSDRIEIFTLKSS